MKATTLAIRHETIYRYEKPVGYSIQQLRLTPRSELLLEEIRDLLKHRIGP